MASQASQGIAPLKLPPPGAGIDLSPVIIANQGSRFCSKPLSGQ
jgi:hypothetical protein